MEGKPTFGIVVDVGMRGRNPGGAIEWRGVNLETGDIFFESDLYEDGTNNVGEALAIMDALKRILRNQHINPVYSDSFTARTWIAKRKFNSKYATRNQALLTMIRDAEEWLRANPNHAQVKMWDTKRWGESPADYQRKH